jgi:hypothetical protein
MHEEAVLIDVSRPLPSGSGFFSAYSGKGGVIKKRAATSS